MKANLHPKLKVIKVKCASCGTEFSVLSLESMPNEIHVEVCSHCHPAYTGKKVTEKVVSSRAEKFRKKYNL